MSETWNSTSNHDRVLYLNEKPQIMVKLSSTGNLGFRAAPGVLIALVTCAALVTGCKASGDVWLLFLVGFLIVSFVLCSLVRHCQVCSFTCWLDEVCLFSQLYSNDCSMHYKSITATLLIPIWKPVHYPGVGPVPKEKESPPGWSQWSCVAGFWTKTREEVNFKF